MSDLSRIHAVFFSAAQVYPMSDQTPLMQSLREMRTTSPSVPIVMAVACRESATLSMFRENMRSIGVLEELASEYGHDALYGRILMKVYRV